MHDRFRHIMCTEFAGNMRPIFPKGRKLQKVHEARECGKPRHFAFSGRDYQDIAMADSVHVATTYRGVVNKSILQST